MNHKQKLGYITLGASLMLIGMWIGQGISPPVTAQHNGELTCKQLTFISETGLPLFTLQAEQTKDKNGSLYIRNGVGKKTMGLKTGILGNSVFVYDTDEKAVVMLHGHTYGGTVYTKSSDWGFSTTMSSREHGGIVSVYGNDGKTAASMKVTEYGGRVDVFNKQGKNRAVMAVNEYGNGAVSTWDKNGYRQ